MNEVEKLTDLDLILLEEILEDEHCEADHTQPQWPSECTHVPVAYFVGCEGLIPICQTIVNHFEIAITGPWKCATCLRPILECWSLTPR